MIAVGIRTTETDFQFVILANFLVICVCVSLAASFLAGSSHHASALDQPGCAGDINYQSSTSEVAARWTVPEALRPYVTNVLWSVQQEVTTHDGTGAFLPLP